MTYKSNNENLISYVAIIMINVLAMTKWYYCPPDSPTTIYASVMLGVCNKKKYLIICIACENENYHYCYYWGTAKLHPGLLSLN